MKKIYLILTMIPVIGLLVFIGCSKEASESIISNNTEVQPNDRDLLIESQILEFQNKISFARENPNLKNGDDLSVEDAVYNIEALANYSYADATFEYDNFITETTVIEVPINNGQVSLVDAGNAYDEVVENLSDQYALIPESEKQMVLTDITLTSTENNIATLNITGGFGASASGPTSPVFGTDDYWKWGLGYDNMGGYCDGPNVGNNTDSDAAMQIEHKLGIRRSLPSGHRYFINIKEVYVNGEYLDVIYDPSNSNVLCETCDLTNENDLTPNDNIRDYYIFRNYSLYPNYDDCIDPSDMNFYLYRMEDIIYDMAYDAFPTELDGKIFSSASMTGNYILDFGSTTLFHEASIYFLTFNLNHYVY